MRMFIQKPGLIEPVKGSRETGGKKSFNVANTLVRVAVGVEPFRGWLFSPRI